MTVTEFLIKKNKIIKHYTGLTLVPEEQIEECKQYPLIIDSNAGICPYCLAYYKKEHTCRNCPMAKQHNKCDDEKSTYQDVIDFCFEHYVTLRLTAKQTPFYNELKSLVKKYNKELK